MAGLKKGILALATAGLLSSGAVQAALNDRGGGLIFDDVLNITWLADANYAQTSGYDSDGRMNFSVANTWAANLVYGGYTDWRLPTALNQGGTGLCVGYNCPGSEMGHMFYNNLGATPGGSAGTNTANLALFTNLQSDVYWSGTVYAPDPASYAWYFYYYAPFIGQYSYFQDLEFYAWAVRPGDVAAPIPEPETYALLLAGLGVLGFMARAGNCTVRLSSERHQQRPASAGFLLPGYSALHPSVCEGQVLQSNIFRAKHGLHDCKT